MTPSRFLVVVRTLARDTVRRAEAGALLDAVVTSLDGWTVSGRIRPGPGAPGERAGQGTGHVHPPAAAGCGWTRSALPSCSPVSASLRHAISAR